MNLVKFWNMSMIRESTSGVAAGADMSVRITNPFLVQLLVLIGLTGTAPMVSTWFVRVGSAISLFWPGNPKGLRCFKLLYFFLVLD